MTRLASVLVLGSLAACAPALAQGETAAQPSRYSFNRVDDGFIRLDNSNGQVAHCTQRAVGWACETVPEDRKALENEIARLTDENAALKAQVAALNNQPPRRPPEIAPPQASDQPKNPEPPRPPASVPPQASDQLNVPGSHNVDRVMAFVGTTWRRVVEMISGWQKDVMHKG